MCSLPDFENQQLMAARQVAIRALKSCLTKLPIYLRPAYSSQCCDILGLISTVELVIICRSTVIESNGAAQQTRIVAISLPRFAMTYTESEHFNLAPPEPGHDEIHLVRESLRRLKHRFIDPRFRQLRLRAAHFMTALSCGPLLP